MLNHLLKIRNCKLKIVFFALILFLLMAKNVDASVINKSPNYLGSSNGLVGYWTMDGSKVNWKTGAVTDSSGRGNTGTITNMATSTGVAIGKIGQALSFDGVDDYVNIGDIAVLEPANVTVSAWIKTSDASKYVQFAGKYNNIAKTGYKLAIEQTSGKTYLQIGIGVATPFSISVNAVTNNLWHYIVGTSDGTNLVLYVDGTQVDTDPGGAISYSTETFLIGKDSDTATYFPGLIDDVRVYNRALPADEIQKLYNAGR